MGSVPQIVITGVSIVAPGKAEYRWQVPDLTGFYSVTGGCAGFTNYGNGGDLEAAAQGKSPERSVVASPILLTEQVLSGSAVVDIENVNTDVTCFMSLQGYDAPLMYDPSGLFAAEHGSVVRSEPFIFSPSGSSNVASANSPSASVQHGHDKGKNK